MTNHASKQYRAFEYSGKSIQDTPTINLLLDLTSFWKENGNLTT